MQRANENINGDENGDKVQRKGGARRQIDRQIIGSNSLEEASLERKKE